MKRMYLLMVVVASLLALENVKGHDLSAEEYLSLYFSEIAVTNDHSLLLRIGNDSPAPLGVRMGTSGPYSFATNGCLFVVEKNIPVYVNRSGAPSQCIRLVGAEWVADRFPHVPLEFRQGNDDVMVFEADAHVSLITPAREVSYTLGDRDIRTFHFPFRQVWRDERERRLWSSGWEFRGRLGEVKKWAEAEKTAAERLYETVKTKFATEIEAASFDWKSTNSLLWVSVDGKLLERHYEVFRLQFEKTEGGGRLIGFRFKTVPEDGRKFCYYRFDATGHLNWYYMNSKRNGVRAIELDSSGGIRRGLYQGVNPLLIVTERTFYFTGDGDVFRQLMKDIEAAMGNWREN